MAFSVAFDGSRVIDASTTTNWTADGATPTAEPDFFYQGGGSISAKVKTTEAGFYYTSASTDMTTPKVWIAKLLANNKDSLDGNGLLLRIGSSTTAYYEYRLFSSTTYPITGGWQIVVIDPNVSQWRDATSGSPSLSAVIHWNIHADYSATAKSENTAMDAIDVVNLGKGLTGTGNTPGGTFDDFITSDEGTSNNRWGIVQTRGGIIYVNAVLTIGSSGVATSFSDSNRVLVFPSQRITNGGEGLDFDVQNASTSISLTSCLFNGRGSLSGSDDTRPDYTVIGTSGAASFISCTFDVFRQIDFTSAATVTNCIFTNGRLINHNSGATITGCTFSGSTAGDGVALVVSNNLANFVGNSFTFSDGHAIEITATGTYTFQGNSFSGYGSDGTNDAAIYNNSGGLVTINVTGGGDTPTFRNGTSASTTINSNVSITLTGLIAGSEVRVYKTADNSVVDGVESSGTSFAFSVAASTSVYIRIFHVSYLPADITGYSTSSDASIPIQQIFDRNYTNP